MGLDSVELIMRYEDAFGVKISDEEGAKLRTPTDVIALITEKVGPGTKISCLTQVTFYRVRKALCAELSLSRRAVRPNTPLNTLITRNRRELWQAVHMRTQFGYWPSLEVPHWLWACSLLTGPLGYGYWLACHGDFSVGALLGFPLSVVAGLLVILFTTRPLHTAFPFENIGQLSRRLAAFNFAALTANSQPSQTQIAVAVREITIGELGLDPAEYREDAEFVRDFGVS